MTIARVLLIVFMLAVTARAEQYWVAYEGNDFPENEGWERVYSAGGADRHFESGTLVIDSRRDSSIVDYYRITRAVDPDPGETFVAEWRMRIDDIPPGFHFDPTVGIFSDKSKGVGFRFSETTLYSVFEGIELGPLAAEEIHSFSLISSDMTGYQLYVDGALLFSGVFIDVFTSSEVSWGDGIQGGRSLTAWDDFSFGVIPEPNSAMALILGAAVLVRRRPRGSHAGYRAHTNGWSFVPLRAPPRNATQIRAPAATSRHHQSTGRPLRTIALGGQAGEALGEYVASFGSGCSWLVGFGSGQNHRPLAGSALPVAAFARLPGLPNAAPMS
jgi:hypothetical protein